MNRLLAVFAHPDDEGLVSGALAHYAKKGFRVSLACVTKGEAGEIHDPSLTIAEGLGSVREQELRCACEIIGISELYLLGYCDSGMEGTPENDMQTAFIQADPDGVRFKLVEIIRRERPQVVITFEPFGWYGHPDHIATSRFATEAYHLAGDQEVFPDAGPAWQPKRLFYAAFPRSEFKAALEFAQTHGFDNGDFDLIPWDAPDPTEGKITHIFDADAYIDIKEQSMICHRSQFGKDHIFLKLPPDIRRQINGKEYYIQADPDVNESKSPNGDLFSGIT